MQDPGKYKPNQFTNHWYLGIVVLYSVLSSLIFFLNWHIESTGTTKQIKNMPTFANTQVAFYLLNMKISIFWGGLCMYGKIVKRRAWIQYVSVMTEHLMGPIGKNIGWDDHAQYSHGKTRKKDSRNEYEEKRPHNIVNLSIFYGPY